MSDLTDVYSALQQADAAGDTAGAQQLADYIRTQSPGTSAQDTPKVSQSYDAIGGQLVPTGSPAAITAQSPTSGMSSFQQFVAGYGKAGYDLARGAGQATGAVSREDVAQSRALDAPLLASPAGRAGDLVGTTADLVPSAFIPGANTLAGAAAIGGGIGALQPSASTHETLRNTGMGAAIAPASIMAGRLAGVAYQGVKGLVTPFFGPGQEGIAASTLQAFAGGPKAAGAAADAISNAGSALPGVEPTTAELANNSGLAQLERTVRSNPEYLQAISERLQGNRQAMTQALGGIAGTEADRTAAEATRAAVSAPMYDAARTASAPVDDALTTLMQRPSMQSAVQRAQRLAAESGQTFGATPGQLSGSDLQNLKMSLSDMVNTGFQQGMGAHEIGAIKQTLGSLNDWIGTNVPSLTAADTAFRDASAPINQMELGQALTDKLQPALADFGGNARLNAASYANALRNGDQLAAKTTGWKGSTLAGTLSPDQMQTVTGVAAQLARRANANELGQAVGSPTAQNLISQNMLRQMLGPLGLPQGWSEKLAQSSLLDSVTRPIQWAGGVGQERVMGRLAQAALDPQYAQTLLTKAQAPSIWPKFQRFLPSGALAAYSSQQ